jgi:MoaA/NifB/PqqE/SkfB family radical SAM enzyme
MKDTIDELPAMVDLAKDLGVDHLYTNHIQVFMEELKDQSLLAHKARANAAFAEARARAAARNMVVVLPEDFDLAAPEAPAPAPHAPEGGDWAGTGAVERDIHRPSELPPVAYTGRCPYLWDQAFFEADGSVFPCCNSGGVAMGHLGRAPDFWSIWRGQPYDRMRASVYTPQCHDICVNCYLREGTHPSEAFVRPVQGAGVGGWQRLRRALGLQGRPARPTA